MLCFKNLFLLALGASAAVLPSTLERSTDSCSAVGATKACTDLLAVDLSLSVNSKGLDVTAKIDGVTLDLQQAISTVESLSVQAAAEIAADGATVVAYLKANLVKGVNDLVATLKTLKVVLFLFSKQIVASLTAFRAAVAAYLACLAKIIPALAAEIQSIAVEIDVSLSGCITFYA